MNADAVTLVVVCHACEDVKRVRVAPERVNAHVTSLEARACPSCGAHAVLVSS